MIFRVQTSYNEAKINQETENPLPNPVFRVCGENVDDRQGFNEFYQKTN